MSRPLQERVERFQQMLAAAGRRLDQETVHQLRVSIRRLQAALRLMGQRESRRALKPLMQLAGEVRNVDITLGLLREAELAPEHEAFEKLRAVRRRHAEALKRAVLGFELPAIKASPVEASPDLLKDFFEAGRRALRRPKAKRLHALRLAGKRLRYAIEFLAPVLGEASKERLEELKSVQDALGAINDGETARALVKDKEFRRWLKGEDERQRKRFAEHWRRSFAGEGARDAWSSFLEPVCRPRAAGGNGL